MRRVALLTVFTASAGWLTVAAADRVEPTSYPTIAQEVTGWEQHLGPTPSERRLGGAEWG